MALRSSSAAGALVLCYHAVSPGWRAPIAVRPEALERQLAGLLSAGYVPTTFHRAVCDPPPGRVLAVTFDDAYRSVIRLAFPVLRGLGIPGTVFAPTGFIGSERPMSWPGIAHWATGADAHELVPMSWDELGELAASGWEIGSHTKTHPRLPALDRPAILAELQDSRVECEGHLGVTCSSLAYPYGEHSPEVVRAAGEAGYLSAGALARHVETPRPLAWPRIGIYNDDEDLRFRLKISPLMRALRASPAWRMRRLLARSRTDPNADPDQPQSQVDDRVGF